MNRAESLWQTFVADARDDSAVLERGVSDLGRDIMAGNPAAISGQLAALDALAYRAFRIACQSFLLGADDLGHLALAIERCLDHFVRGTVHGDLAAPTLITSTVTLHQAIVGLERTGAGDRSGAHTDSVPLQAARYELETLFPVPGAGPAGAPGAAGPDVPVSALTRGRSHGPDHEPGASARGGSSADVLGGSGDTSSIDRMLAGGRSASPGAGSSGDGVDVTAGEARAADHLHPAEPPDGPDSGPAIGLTGVATPPGDRPGVFVWEPSVDEDMLELFFEEADERIEDLAIKLLDVEKRPDDSELLRDVFRDLHTLKGSSAMVALDPMNQLAHAAEDLVGQLRDGQRRADGAIIDAMLAALDGLRDLVALAKQSRTIEADLGPIVAVLRDPYSGSAAPGVAIAGASGVAAGASEEDDALSPPSSGTGRGRAASRPGAPASQAARQTIRVDFDKLDRLMNLVGELVLGRDRLHGALRSLSAMSTELSSDRQLSRRLLGARRSASGGERARATGDRPADRDDMRHAFDHLADEIGRVERVLDDIAQDLDHASGRLDSVSDELRDQVMKLRMVPIGGVFRKHHRTVRDLAGSLGKRVQLELSGEDTELDKLLVEALDEPLMHLVRNAVDHGIEPPGDRVTAGKSAEGTIRLTANHRGNQMVIEIADDGKGMDPDALRRRARVRELASEAELEAMDDHQILELIFRPGFSTATTVSSVSGRGVGMDVVKQTIVSRLKGTIDIDSTPGRGSAFTLRLPLTLAIIQVVLARAGGEVLAIPLASVVRTIPCSPDSVQLVQDREVIAVRGRQVPLVRVAEVLELGPTYDRHAILHVVLVAVGSDLYGLACDHLMGKKEIVIKSLGDLLEEVPCAAGATLLGDRCALILDVPAVVTRAIERGLPGRATGRGATAGSRPAVAADAPHVLVVDDSDTVRESLRRLLVDGGYRCTVASDGVEGLSAASARQFDLVSTDVMMPRMDGYELTRALRATSAYRDTPIIMVTSRGERIDRVRGFDAGVDEYITKPHDRQLFLRSIRKLLGDRTTAAEPMDSINPTSDDPEASR